MPIDIAQPLTLPIRRTTPFDPPAFTRSCGDMSQSSRCCWRPAARPGLSRVMPT